MINPLVKILFVLAALHFLQIGFAQNITLRTQNDIDSFSIIHPDISSIHSLIIKGDDILNLEGLKQLSHIEWGLTVEQTSVVDLNGLENIVLPILNNITIWDNKNLSDINILESYDLSILKSIRIGYNENLNVCRFEIFCNFMRDGKLLDIHSNGINCSNWSQLYNDCEVNIATSERELVFEEGFESWTEVIPNGWSLDNIDSSLINEHFYKIDAIGDGLSSCEILSFASSSPSSFGIFKDLSISDEIIDISLTFHGLFTSEIIIHMVNTSTEDLFSKRLIFQKGTNGIYTVQLNNIGLESGYDKFTYLEFRVYPIYIEASVPIYIAGKLAIDDLKIYKHNINSTSDLEQKVGLYPNPATNLLEINTYEQQFDQIEIFDLDGDLVKSLNFSSSLNVQDFLPGLYLLKLRKDDQSMIIRFVKN